jgi:hypothetical protein
MSDEPELPEENPAQEIDHSEIEDELQRLYLQERMPEAEITNTIPLKKAGGEKVLVVEFGVSGGGERMDTLPTPDRFKPEQSDLATLIEFVGATPGNLSELVGQRVPFYDGEIRYDVMRQVLRAEENSVTEWEYEKRMKKARRAVGGEGETL